MIIGASPSMSCENKLPISNMYIIYLIYINIYYFENFLRNFTASSALSVLTASPAFSICFLVVVTFLFNLATSFLLTFFFDSSFTTSFSSSLTSWSFTLIALSNSLTSFFLFPPKNKFIIICMIFPIILLLLVVVLLLRLIVVFLL